MDKESQDTKTPWRRPAKGKFIALIPNDAGIIEPVEINTGKEDVTLGEVRRAVYHRALEVVQWVREALDETPQTPENEQWRHGLIWMGELGVDVMNIVNSPGINKPGTVLDLDIIVDIYELALSCSFIGRCHQLAELADVLTAEQLQRKTFSMLSDMRREHADHDARTTAEHREHDTKLEGVPPLVGEARDADARDIAALDAYMTKLKLPKGPREVYRLYRLKMTQEQIATSMKCDVRTVRRYGEAINAAFAKAGRPGPIVWGNKKSRSETATKAGWAGGVTSPDDPEGDRDE